MVSKKNQHDKVNFPLEACDSALWEKIPKFYDLIVSSLKCKVHQLFRRINRIISGALRVKPLNGLIIR